MDTEELKRQINDVIDSWAGKQPEPTAEPVEERVLPVGKRVARTKSQGDRVYLLDDNADPKTRTWLLNPEVLAASGFTMADVVEVTDDELTQYKMLPATHRVEA